MVQNTLETKRQEPSSKRADQVLFYPKNRKEKGLFFFGLFLKWMLAFLLL